MLHGFSLSASANNGVAAMFALLIIAVGWLFFLGGCASYAQGKGHHPAFGLFGIIGLFGLIVLAVMPDRHS